jgi:hypothetical protein
LIFLFCLYAAIVLAAIGLAMTRNWPQARRALVAAPAALSGIILAEGGAAARGPFDIPGFETLALAVAAPLLGLALMALFVTRWRWLLWLVLALNILAGVAVFSIVWLVSTMPARPL